MTIVQEGLGAIRVVKAFAQGAFERAAARTRRASRACEAALYARRVRSLLGPVVTALVAHRHGGGAVVRRARWCLTGAMTAGALVVFLTYLGKLFRPIQDLARASTNIAQAAVGLERVRAVLDADERLPRAPHARPLGRVDGRVEFRDVDVRLRRRPPGAARTSRSSSSPASSSAWSARAAAASRRWSA